MGGPRAGVRLGIDVGGTFTDAILWNETTGEVTLSKVPSTPGSFADGVLVAAAEALERAHLIPADVTYLIHGSTVASNVVAEKRGAMVGLITTLGFRDVLELQRHRRDALYDLFYEKPMPLVPRYLRLEVPERLNARGEVLVPLDEPAARRAIATLKERGCQAIAVVFLFSFLNDSHERRVEELIRQEFPEAFVSLSSVVNPEFREYERASTTVVDAYIKPEVTAYYTDLERRLREHGYTARLDIMQSGGGVMAVRDAARRPVHTIESGPAAGAIAAAHIARTGGLEHVIAFDMGGTTAKACLIEGGQLKTISTLRVARLPVNAPVIDLIEISGGGGTLAWIDSSGLLRLGPRSAGADPGPACYGRGGQLPTISDASAILGYLNPHYFLGGKMPLDIGAARRAVEPLCDHLGLVETQAALGILRIANAAMEGAIRVVTTQRGIDARTCVLIAFGGAGPVHAAFLAQQLGVSQVLVPPVPGNVSALGTLVADVRYDYVRTFYQSLEQADARALFRAYAELESNALGSLKDLSSSDLQQLAFKRVADLRYVGQGFELAVPFPEARDELSGNWREKLSAAFHETHRARYKYDDSGAPVEVVALRVVAWLKAKPVRFRAYGQRVNGHQQDAYKGKRLAFFPGRADPLPVGVYERAFLEAGERLAGPAIIEEYSSTTVLPPDCELEVDERENLIIHVGGAAT